MPTLPAQLCQRCWKRPLHPFGMTRDLHCFQSIPLVGMKHISSSNELSSSMAVRMGRGLIEKQHVPCSLAHARRCLLADAQLPAMRLLPLKDLCPRLLGRLG